MTPILDRDFPDPCLLRVGGRWYAYATATVVYGVIGMGAMWVWVRLSGRKEAGHVAAGRP